MRTLSFVTRYNPVYRGPVTEINVDNVPIALAIPLAPRKKGDDVDLEKERNRMSTFTDQIMKELTKDEYGLCEQEITAIVDYLTANDDLFSPFSYENIKKAQGK